MRAETRDIVMHPQKGGKVGYSYILGSCEVQYRNICSITEGSIWEPLVLRYFALLTGNFSTLSNEFRYTFIEGRETRDIVMHPQKGAKVGYSYILSWSCGVHLIEKHLQHSWRIHLGFTIASFQFSMLNIFHPYGCHLKGRAILWWAACLCELVKTTLLT